VIYVSLLSCTIKLIDERVDHLIVQLAIIAITVQDYYHVIYYYRKLSSNVIELLCTPYVIRYLSDDTKTN
jgi:hypothetical protein